MCPYKRRVTYYIIKVVFGDNGFPVGAEGIALMDIGVALQGQEIDILMDDALGLCQHLRLTDP